MSKRLDTNVLSALHKLNNSRRHNNSIPLLKIIEGKKIILHILTTLQIQVMKSLKNVTLCIDGTGIKVEAPLANIETEIQQKPPAVFLYAITATTKSQVNGTMSTIAAGQMISQSHTVKTVQEWLEEHRQASQMNVAEVITDASATLMSAVCMVIILLRKI